MKEDSSPLSESETLAADEAKAARRSKLSQQEKARLLADVARLYFVDRKGQTEIVDILQRRGVHALRDGTMVSRWLAESRSARVVSFDIDYTFGLIGREDRQLGDDLRDRFELDTLVIEVDANAEQDKDHLHQDDHLHIVLGNHAGIQVGGQFATGDQCAVAGGRAVNQAVRMIKRHPPRRQNIRITPMSGRIWSHWWHFSGPSIFRPLDPDDSAFILFLAFEGQPGAVFDQVGHELFAESRNQAAILMRRHCSFLPGGQWLWGTPRRAIVGVGVIDPDSGHRAADLLRAREKPELAELARYLETVKDDLANAAKIVSSRKLYFGDLANRYFATLPLPHEVASDTIIEFERIYARLLKELDRLNQRMLVVEWSHLRSISEVTAIAGGAFKVRALWTILLVALHDKSRRLINTLVTDSETARKLIVAFDSYKNSDLVVKEWYQKMAGMIFSDRSLERSKRRH